LYSADVGNALLQHVGNYLPLGRTKYPVILGYSTISRYITSTLINYFESIPTPKEKSEDDRLGSPTAAHSKKISLTTVLS